LIVVHAFTLVQPAMEVEALKHGRSMQRMDLEGFLFETVEKLAPVAGRAASVLGEGSPMDLIRATAERRPPALVVLGTHGAGTLERHVIGSVAEEIVRTIQTPVLTVGPHVAAPSDRLTFGHILYATDFSRAAAHAAPYAIAIARSFASVIDLLHVVSGELTRQSDSLTERGLEFLTALDQLVPEKTREPFRSLSFVESGKVRERILGHASGSGADLIVLGAHHHSRLAMHFRTGPAFQIIVAAACPVLTICRS
jgi:nucleotide-binding universal stress UspA family protein